MKKTIGVPGVIGIALCAASFVAPAGAQQPPRDAAVVTAGKAPGKGAVGAAVQKVATVEAIDRESRTVTLKTPEGRVTRMVVGPDVRNLDQVSVGDLVVTTYVEAVSLTLKKGGDGIRERAESTRSASAPDGSKPGGAVQHRVTVVADVIAANPRTRVLTLRGPDRTIDLRVPDANQFTRVQVGDQVEATFTEALIIAVRPAPKR
jgi:hypothetical protein